MTTPLQPGVFVDVSQTPLAASVPQSNTEGVAAFCLPYNTGPTTVPGSGVPQGVPVQVQNFTQFTNLFGSFAQSGGSMLHHAVYQFFANGGPSCFVCRIPNLDASAASLILADLGLTAPVPPSPTNSVSGGTVAAGVYQVKVTYVNASGETLPSTAGTTTTTGSASTLTIPSPAAMGSATSWYAYVTQVNGSTFTRQQTFGSPTALGTPLTITAPPSSGGTAPPSSSTATDNVATIKANGVGVWGNSVFVAITSANGLATGGGAAPGPRFNLLVFNGGTTVATETFPSLSLNPADSRYAASVINSPVAGSKYISLTVTLPTGGYVQGVTDPAFTSATALSAGSDGSTVPTSTSSTTLAAMVQNAFNALPEQILNLNMPGLVNNGGAVDVATLNSLLTWADGRGNVMLIIDGPPPNPPQSSAAVAAIYTGLITGSPAVTSDANAVIYAPWEYVLDPSSSVPGAMRYVPPGGAVLALWNQAVTQFGIQQPPAGTWAQVATPALQVSFSAVDQQNLLAAQINPILPIPNVGFCVFGARTQATGLPSRYVNVQRAIIQLTNDMQSVIMPFAFQPNNSDLWSSITSALTTYLMQRMQSGMLAGNTPSSSFTVVCDSTINTPTTSQSGYVYANVGVALQSPAEFIVITLQLLSGTATADASQ